MQGKITLITPPDIFENNNTSVLFIHLSDQDQDAVSKWLKSATIDQDLNFYIYSGEPNLPWLLYAIGCCQYKYIDLDSLNYVTQAMSGYMLSKPGFTYKISDEAVAEVYSHINHNRVNQIESFLERILSDQTK
jgi:hypothetical protein